MVGAGIMADLLNDDQARRLVGDYMDRGDTIVSTQDILESGAIPRLKGYQVQPGKVSDSIFGGPGSYKDKTSGETVSFENPPLVNADGVPMRIMVRSQRISTHDIGRGEVPFKDQILAANHNYMRRMLSDTFGTSQFDVEGLLDSSVVIAAEDLEQIPFENVLRAYNAKSSTTTSLYQHHLAGSREYCGHKLPDDLIANGVLPYVMDTPSTKSDEHDESVSPQQLFDDGICTPAQYDEIRNSSLFAFGRVSQFLRDRGLIAVDTKTEHGVNHAGKIVSQDEIWTMDSSRFWMADDYAQQLLEMRHVARDELAPKSFSKEFARGFSKGDEGYTDEQRLEIAVRYIDGVQKLLRKRFEPETESNRDRVVGGLQKVVDQLVA